MNDERDEQQRQVEDLNAWELPEYEVDRLLATGDDARLKQLFGPDYEELRKLAREASAASRSRARKTVVFLPGILGSSLGKPRLVFGHDTIWLDPVSIAWGDINKLKLTRSSKVKSLGVLPIYHNFIRFRLMIAGYRVLSFHYDWRRSIPELGQRLVDFVEEDRADEVMLVAHSMGGLVSRAALEIGSDKVKRLVMIGTPNHGSFAPVQLLQGINSTLQMVCRIDGSEPVDLVRSTFSSFRSVHEMLPRPGVFDDIDLFKRTNWPAEPFRPTTTRLSAVEDAWDGIADPDDRFHLIAGYGQPTISDLRVGDDGGFEYFKSADAGDGTVPLRTCEMEGVPTRYANAEHVGLLRDAEVAKAVVDLLKTGETERLDKAPSSSGTGRGQWLTLKDFQPKRSRTGLRATAMPADEAAEMARVLLSFSSLPVDETLEQSESRIDDESPAASPTGASPLLDGVRLTETFVNRDRQAQVDIELVHRSLFDLPYRAIVLGIFEDVDPGGPANYLNKLTNGAVEELVERRMFDGSLGRVFVMPTGRNLLKCEQVVFMGMGRYADFVEKPDAIIRAASSNTLRTLLHCGVDEFATVIYGGSSGLPIRDAVKSMICGYLETIQQMKSQENGVVFRRLGLCEINDERYAELKREVVRFAFTDDAQDMRVRLHEPSYSTTHLAPVPDASRKSPEQERVDISYLTVRLDVDETNEADGQLYASLLTSGGSAAVYPSVKNVDTKQLDEIISKFPDASIDELESYSEDLKQLLFEEGFCQLLESSPLGDSHTAVIHNALASRVPWEVLRLGQEKYPCLTTGVSRRHEADGGEGIAKYLRERQKAETLNILLVVDPTNDLPGARAEGKAVREIVGSVNDASVTVLEQEEATRQRVLDLLGSGRFDVMHYAGHAFFDPADRRRSGLICADETLRSADIQQLDRLPSLVFFNACESGRVRKRGPANHKATLAEKREQNVGIAEALLRGGVAQFVGTYWPVGDRPAKLFAQKFYQSLTTGAPIYKAVLAGRNSVFEQDSVDFADYLHYGSPTFRVKRR